MSTFNWRYYFDTFFLFLLIFGPKIPGSNFDTLSVVCLISIILHYKYLGRVIYAWDFWMTYICSTYILLILWIWINPDFWHMPKAIRILINYLGVFVFTLHALTQYGKHRTAPILRMLHNALTLHAVVVVMMVVSPTFKAFIEGIAGKQTRSTWQIKGLTGGLGTPMIVIAFPFVTYALFSLHTGYKERLITIKLVLISMCTVFMGRMGFYMNIGTAFLVMSLAAIRLKGLPIFGKSILFIAIVGGLALNIGLGNMDDSLAEIPIANDYIVVAFKHSMELFVNTWRDRKIETKSTTNLLSSAHRGAIVYHNEGVLQMLFGTSLYGRGNPFTYLPTDIAYLHMFSAFGIIGILLFLMAYTIPIFQNLNMRHTPLYWASFILIMMVIFANFKETVLFTRNVYSVHVFILTWLFYERRRNRRGGSLLFP